jgi:hypothetical protein
VWDRVAGRARRIVRRRIGKMRRHIATLFLAALSLAACAGPAIEELRNPVPESLASAAAVPGYQRIRFWGDDADFISREEIDELRAQRIAAAEADPGQLKNPVRFLTVSGGGSDGAFGAGLLVGWTGTGKRPEFDIVTGISTGALIAPFAFLGPAYDPLLRANYTQVTGKDIYKKKGALATLTGDSAADDTPLKAMVARQVDAKLIEAVAVEHRKGRRLLIGTTNLDAQRPVVWNMGAIAVSDQPNKAQLFRDILIASASIPGAFPPVRLSVTADGQRFDELHVDGGTTNQVFMLPSGFSLHAVDKETGNKRRRILYVIRNGRTSPEYRPIKPKLMPIAAASISTLIRTQGIGDLYRMYAQARRDGIDYNFISIPDDFTLKETTPFEPSYMKALFARGETMAAGGIPWAKVPPGFSE